MPKRGYCASCGREVWLGRDGGCQFGHPAAQMSAVHDADPKAVQPAAPAQPAAQSHPQQSPRPAQPHAPAPVVPAAFAQPAAMAPVPVAPVPVAPVPAQRAYVPPPPVDAVPTADPFGVAGTAALATPAAAADAAWGNSPDDLIGGGAPTFDYTALKSDVEIGDTDCLFKRSVARVLDNVLVGGVIAAFTIPIFIAVVMAAQASRGTAPPPEPPPWLNVMGFVLYAAYFVLLPTVWNGRTIGKAIMGIAVTDLHDHKPTIAQLAIRELAMMIPDGLFNGIVGLVIASKNSRNQRAGDQWANTVVVRTR